MRLIVDPDGHICPIQQSSTAPSRIAMWGPLDDHLPSPEVLGQWGRWCGRRGRLPLRGSCINLEMAFVGGPDRAGPPREVSYRYRDRWGSGTGGPGLPLSIAAPPVPKQQLMLRLMLCQGRESFPAIPSHPPGDGQRQQRSELCLFLFLGEIFGLGLLTASAERFPVSWPEQQVSSRVIFCSLLVYQRCGSCCS